MIFIDAGAFVGFYVPSDPFHAAALRGWERIARTGQAVFTSSLCVAEAVTVLGRASRDFAWAADVGEKILALDALEIHAPTRADLARATARMRATAARRIGLVDCLSFVLMEARRVDVAFTFDREHFVKAAKFRAWEPIVEARAD